MVTKKKKLLLSLCLSTAFLAAGAGVAGAVAESVASGGNSAYTTKDAEKNEYLLGEKINGKTVFEKVGAADYSSVCYLYFPSGECRTVNEASEFTLGERGIYTVTCGQKTANFTVNAQNYSVSGARSKLAIGKAADYSAYSAGDGSGAIVSLAFGDRFTSNEIIDLSGKTGETPIAEFSVLPQTAGTADARKIEITLTDAYDPSNTLTVFCKQAGTGVEWKEIYTYCTAHAAGQVPQGLEAKSTGTFVYEGNTYNRHLNDYTGTGVRFSMSGLPEFSSGLNEAIIGEEKLSISYDDTTKRIYANGSLVIDLDDPALQSNPWGGFTSGECFLSVSASAYNASYANLLIRSINGKEIKTNETVRDVEGPALFVDDEELSEIDRVFVGEKVKLPAAVARDSYDGTVRVKRKVYTGYLSSAQAEVLISGDSFVPRAERTYTVEYSAADCYGNVTKKRYNLTAVASDPESSLSLTTKNAIDRANVGQTVLLGEPIVTNATGDYKIDIFAKRGEEITPIANNVRQGDDSRFTFLPLQAGIYEIVYEYSDYIFEKTYSYTLTVSPEGEPTFTEEAVLPRYILKNAEYALPELYGYVFEQGKGVSKKAELYVNGEKPSGASKTFKITSGETCSLRFVLGSAEKSYVIPVIDAGYGTDKLKIYEYFQGYTGTPESTARGTKYTVKQSGETRKLSFINTVQCFDFDLGFTVPENAPYGSLTIRLIDTENPKNVLSFRYKKSGTATLFSVNGGADYSLYTNFTGTAFELSYDNSAYTVRATDSFDIKAKTAENGEEWRGFAKNKAWLEIELGDVAGTEAAEITVNSVNNQMISNAAKDVVRPQISLATLTGTFNAGQKVTLPPVYFADVLTPFVTCSLTVKRSDGTVVSSTDGVELNGKIDVSREYEILLEQYGEYSVLYTASDGSREQTYTYKIQVEDSVAPVTEIGEAVTDAKIGETVKIAKITVSDNLTLPENCAIFTYVQVPNGEIVRIGGDSFVPQTAGVYTVFYYVYDETGNVAIARYTVTVTA